ncbi:uncharacterized protein LOC131614167 [Vicia villosa]|uniref:uncharacterized protein LOC131614167 n=1 Tax=Vicia villosa TaxID=3911 RepID=UPI00273B09CB|nr:uncharacterized protein LOC131614167 [Vicia villosa]
MKNICTLGPDGRPTNRRRRIADEAGPSVPVPQPQERPQPARFPEGPSDRLLLVRYEDHVARRIWFGEERGPKKELKVAGHGTKLQDRVPHMLPPERWHIETSSFHMPFGEMTINLDDVASLLHLPIGGLFWYPEENVTEEKVVELGIQYLGVERGVMAKHVCDCKGAYYSLQ